MFFASSSSSFCRFGRHLYFCAHSHSVHTFRLFFSFLNCKLHSIREQTLFFSVHRHACRSNKKHVFALQTKYRDTQYAACKYIACVWLFLVAQYIFCKSVFRVRQKTTNPRNTHSLNKYPETEPKRTNARFALYDGDHHRFCKDSWSLPFIV